MPATAARRATTASRRTRRPPTATRSRHRRASSLEVILAGCRGRAPPRCLLHLPLDPEPSRLGGPGGGVRVARAGVLGVRGVRVPGRDRRVPGRRAGGRGGGGRGRGGGGGVAW